MRQTTYSRSVWRRYLGVLAGSALVFISAGGESDAAEVSRVRAVGSEGTAFVSQALIRRSIEGSQISRQKLEESGLKPTEIDSFLAAVEFAHRQVTTRDVIENSCPVGMDTHKYSAPADLQGKRLADWIRQPWATAFVAEVREKSVGWAPEYRSVATAVTFQVKYAFEPAALDATAKEITSILVGGWLPVGETTMCSRGIQAEPMVGATVLVLGRMLDTNPRTFHFLDAFPITNDLVDTTGCSYCSDAASLSLEALKKETLQ